MLPKHGSTTFHNHSDSPVFPTSSVSRMPLEMPTTIVLRDMLVSLFLDMYLPAGFHLPSPSPITRPNEALSLNNPGQVLSLSIQALSTTQLGRISGDEVLTKQGNMLYVHALRELRIELWDRQLMCRDETLAAARTLDIYEVSEMNTSKLLYGTKISQRCQDLRIDPEFH